MYEFKDRRHPGQDQGTVRSRTGHVEFVASRVSRDGTLGIAKFGQNEFRALTGR